jgi:hydroxyethylthiazole kinase-like uncharacterized protein yjeF
MKIFTAEQIRACDEITIQNEGITSLLLMERAARICTEWLLKDCPERARFHVFCGVGNNGGDGLAISRMLLDAGRQVAVYALDTGKARSADCQFNLDLLLHNYPNRINYLTENDSKVELSSEFKLNNFLRLLESDPFGEPRKRVTSRTRSKSSEHSIDDKPSEEIILDALFGTGLNRPVEGWVSGLIHQINAFTCRKIAIDIPSGLMSDRLPDSPIESNPPIIRADDTLSFQFHKRSFLHAEGGLFTGRVHILDIQLSKRFIEDTQTDYHTIDADTLTKIIKPRPIFAHKGTFGTALIIAGSYGMMGAAVLSAKAALRSGVGKVCGWVPECGYEIFQMGVPEATCIVGGGRHISVEPNNEAFFLGRVVNAIQSDKTKSQSGNENPNSVESSQNETNNPAQSLGDINPTNTSIDILIDNSRYQAIGVGPGIGQHPETASMLREVLKSAKIPLVLDADALNIIASEPDLMTLIPRGSILTPHPGEFKRLFGSAENSFEMVELAKKVAREIDTYIILKGRHSIVACPDGKCWYNLTGNSGMATGGSGDVLTGLLAGLLAQGYSARDASLIGVYVHGLAGDISAEKHSQHALLASDIIESLGDAWKTTMDHK